MMRLSKFDIFLANINVFSLGWGRACAWPLRSDFWAYRLDPLCTSNNTWNLSEQQYAIHQVEIRVYSLLIALFMRFLSIRGKYKAFWAIIDAQGPWRNFRKEFSSAREKLINQFRCIMKFVKETNKMANIHCLD